MVETISTTTTFPSTVEQPCVTKFADSIVAHSNCAEDAYQGALVIQSGDSKPYPPEFYTPYLSALSHTWRRSPIRVLGNPGRTLSLLAGKPNPSTFPIQTITMNVRSPVPPFTETSITINDDRLEEALQYGHTSGHPDLVKFFTEMQTRFHGRKKISSWRISVGAGSQDLLYKAFLTLTDPSDVVLVEAPTYAGVVPILASCGADCVEVPADRKGIISSALRDILENWPEGKKMPKYFYTVPYGCNPTGATTSMERRLEVLALARKYKFLILEDDPYYLLYYGDQARPESYFALEEKDNEGTGLVLRFDSLSKVLSPGLRVGFITGPVLILDKIDSLTTSANLQPSCVSQSIALAVLNYWGIQGFRDHCHTVSQFYKRRRDVFEAALNKHLGGMIEYTSPVAGMFLWIKLLIPPPNNDSDACEGDSAELINVKAFNNGVMALPGTSCFANGRRSAYIRASFVVLNDEDTDEALRRLAEVVRETRGEKLRAD